MGQRIAKGPPPASVPPLTAMPPAGTRFRRGGYSSGDRTVSQLPPPPPSVCEEPDDRDFLVAPDLPPDLDVP